MTADSKEYEQSSDRECNSMSNHDDIDGTSESRKRLQNMLCDEIHGREFTELYGVTFHHSGAKLAGFVLLDALDSAGFSVGDYDAVGALTTAAVPLVDAMLHAAASRGQELDAFVMDFVYPSIKGPSIQGKNVILVDAWLSEKSYVQTSSLVTLRNGNELSLDCGIVSRQGARIIALASLVGGIGKSQVQHISEVGTTSERGQIKEPASQRITIIDPVDASEQSLPFVCAFQENLFLSRSQQETSTDTDSAFQAAEGVEA